MARIRTIKPSFFRHSALFDAERETGMPLRVAFAGLWTAADREGRFLWDPRNLKLDCLPYDDVDFSRVLDALTTRGFVEKYASQGTEYGYIPGFARHQVINNREAASTLPDPQNCERLTREARVVHASHTPLVHALGEGKGREQEGKGREQKEVVAHASRAPRPTRWPSDAVVSEEWIAAAAERRATRSLPPIDLALEAETFANHFAAVGGSRGTKTDWFKTWINWALRAHANGKHSTRQHGQRSVAGDVFGKFYADARAKREAAGG